MTLKNYFTAQGLVCLICKMEIIIVALSSGHLRSIKYITRQKLAAIKLLFVSSKFSAEQVVDVHLLRKTGYERPQKSRIVL